MEQNDLNYSGQYLDDKYFKIKIATGGDIYNAAGNAVAGEMFLVTGAQPALYAAKSTSTFNEGIVDHEIYKVKDLNDTVKIKNAGLMNFPGSANASNRYSLSFDGADDYTESSVPAASTWSVSLWFKPAFNNETSLQTYTLISDKSGVPQRLSLNWTSMNHSAPYIDFGFYQAGYPYTIKQIRTYDLTVLDKWNNVVITRNGHKPTYIAYVNGQKIGEHVTATDQIDPFAPQIIGSENGGNTPFRGQIDQVGWWPDRLLNASEVTSIYNDGLNGNLLDYSPSSFWRMGDDDGDTSATIKDIAGGYDATINGPVVVENIQKSSVYSLELDGSTSASLASNISFSGPFTISAWIKPNQTGSGLFFGQYTGSSIEVRYSDDAFSFYVGSDYANTTASYPNNSWHHVMVVRDSSDAITFYVNGASDTNTSLTKSGTLTLAGLISSTYGYIGLSDEYAVWDSDQSSNIAEIYNGGIPANLDSLAPIGWWRMGDDDSGSGATITDQGSGANHATIAGNATYSTQTPE